ncbi:GTP-binding protein REM 1 [Parasteatoda tepidariorum]|uniref:GTP-binding protein REM 1 n=1 Tax=Parasteatoda tepidariorum TaxID=114398 RepID=UPI0039BC9274
MEKDLVFGIPKLTGTNYHLWAMKMEAVLNLKKLMSALTEEAPTDPGKLQVWETTNQDAPSLEEFVNADAIMVTYTVTDRNSFRRAVLCLNTMRNIANRQPPASLPLGPGLRSKAVILVGNKSDLARVRSVTTENGRSAANKYDVKFIETSVIIHHNVDELLVGTLSQVRLKARQAEVLSCKHHAKLTTRAKNLWFRLLHKCDLRFNSCDNLLQL